MKIRNGCIRTAGTLTAPALLLHLGSGMAYAAEGWRPTYDLVMLWFNFGLLAFVVYRFGKGPILNFLKMRRKEVTSEIDTLEQEKARIKAEIEKTADALKESDVRFEELKRRVVARGERRRQEIIDDARKQSEFMMEVAKQKIDNTLIQARSRFREELVDAAIDMAGTRLPSVISEEDNRKLLETYLNRARIPEA